ncbi:MAG: hypothetical protein JW990_06585 [Thermoleophilia bacterium]|nr:hypothetical protein [Thermoleophilia bacterium]
MLIISDTRTEPDTPRYTILADLILHGRVADGQGISTPGYPGFLILNSSNHDAVRVSQFVLGLAIAAGVFYVLWKLTSSRWLATAGALLYGLNLAVVFMESTLMTEPLATFLLVASLVLLVSIRRDAARLPLKLVALGAAVGVLPLVRPLYVYMPLLLAIPLIGTLKTRRSSFWLYLIPAILPVVLWMGYLGSTFGYFGLQTASGFGWTNHAGTFMRDAPERYAVIRDIYLRHVALRHGASGDVIWGAIGEMQRATGQSYPELSQTVQRMSLELLVSHPGGYSKQVATAFVSFWKGISLAENWRPFGTLTHPAWMLSRLVGVIVSAWFCLVVPCLLAARLKLLRLPTLPWPSTWLVLSVLTAAVVQAVVEFGSAPRFGMPTYPYVVVVALCALDVWVLRRKAYVKAQPKER